MPNPLHTLLQSEREEIIKYVKMYGAHWGGAGIWLNRHDSALISAIVAWAEKNKKNGMEDGSSFNHYAWEAYNNALDDLLAFLEEQR